MTESQKFEAILDGYVVMAQNLTADWVGYLDGLAATITSPTYGPDAAAAEFPAFMKLVADSVSRVVGEAGDALATLTSSFDQHAEAAFTIDLDPGIGAEVVGELALTIKDDLAPFGGGAVFPKEGITVVPSTMTGLSATGVLRYDGIGMAPGLYDGFLVATDANGYVAGEGPVTVTVA